MTFYFGLGDRGGGPGFRLETGVPVLGGATAEALAQGVEPAGSSGSFRLWRGDRVLAGFSQADPGLDLEGASQRAYLDMLEAVSGRSLYRVWNFVPRINNPGPGGLENYKAFCLGRSLAFERALGPGFQSALPASSAVGGPEDRLTVVFLAGDAAVEHFENPVQLPAYRYPPEHGPRPPSFARATLVAGPGGLDAFISGTSAIVGHATDPAHDTVGQIARTLGNLALISRACGLGDRLGEGAARARHFKAYLRHGSDQGAVERALSAAFVRPGDTVTYLRADVCREALNVEIEVTLRGAARS
jgi:chorismate lyase/3-hydroxybenzoate synthase